MFYDDLSAVLERLATYSCPVVICGDFNVHIHQIDDPNAVRLHQLLQSFGCIQHVTEPTHTAGHTLGLVMTSSETDISGVQTGDMISEHVLVRLSLRAKKPRQVEESCFRQCSVEQQCYEIKRTEHSQLTPHAP